MKRPKETLCNSTDVQSPFLDFDFGRNDGLRGKLEHRYFLPFKQVGQQHHLAIRKFQRIMMHSRVVLIDLPKDRRRVLDDARCPSEPSETYRRCKSKFCSRKNANRGVGIFRRSKPDCPGVEVPRFQFLANFGWP